MTESPPKMNRKDRLLALIGHLRDGELHLAAKMAHIFNVSQRTLYRDMDTLKQSGVPICGTRGTGYRLTAPVTLPPINLTMDELEVLHLGLAVMTEASDPALRQNARSLAEKIDEALPEDGISPTTSWGLAVFPFADSAVGVRHIPTLRLAIRSQQKLRICYRDLNKDQTDSIVHPLKLEYWGRVWTVTVWCETEKSPKSLRVDRIVKLTEIKEKFTF